MKDKDSSAKASRINGIGAKPVSISIPSDTARCGTALTRSRQCKMEIFEHSLLRRKIVRLQKYIGAKLSIETYVEKHFTPYSVFFSIDFLEQLGRQPFGVEAMRQNAGTSPSQASAPHRVCNLFDRHGLPFVGQIFMRHIAKIRFISGGDNLFSYGVFLKKQAN